MSNLKIKLAHPSCLPHVGSTQSAGLDLRAFLGTRMDAAIEILPRDTKVFGTGVSVAIPEGWVGIVAPRSSTGKLRLSLENTLGVIDSDYRGELLVRLYNYGDEPQVVYNFDRLLQLVIVPHFNPHSFTVVTELDETERGEQGWGHSGRN